MAACSKACSDRAAGYALSIVKNRADAEDAVQRAAMRGLERIAGYDPQMPFKAWWFTVLRNCCIDLLHSRTSHVALVEDTQAMAPEAGSDPAAWRSIAGALEILKPEESHILRLKYFGGLSYEELSHALEIPKGTVMSRLHYARKRLAIAMKESDHG
jgi:RNA polymerase sigma-70 factor (ECF subfamily)